MLRVLSVLALAGTSQASYDGTTPIVSMSDYSKDTRSLDCWECFDAEGFMCHDDTQSSQIKATGSSNRAHGVCCKPGFSGEHCNSEGAHTCSQPVSGTGDGYDSVLTMGKNYQMFAFCPSTGNQKECGISDDAKNLDMTITAKVDPQTIALDGDNALAYNTGSPSTRNHDSCYYLLVADPAAPKKYLNVKITKADQANVYLYGGKSKMDSKTSIVPENAALEVGKTYTFDASLGGFLVAYPNKDQKTSFEFNYWQGDTAPVESSSAMMVIVIVVVVVMIVVILVAVMKIKKNKENNQIKTEFVNEVDNTDDKSKNEELGTIELPQKEAETDK